MQDLRTQNAYSLIIYAFHEAISKFSEAKCIPYLCGFWQITHTLREMMQLLGDIYPHEMIRCLGDKPPVSFPVIA